MDNTQLFDGIEFLKTLSLIDFLMFFIYLSLIFALRTFLVFLLQKSFTSKRFKERIFPFVEDLLNWLAIYGAIFFFLFYFSEEQWLFYPFYETDGIQVSVFLIVVVAIAVSFAGRLVRALNRYVMPFFYVQFDVDATTGYTINRLLYYIVMFIALALGFTTVGLDLSALGVIFSVLGIGIGFGIRNIAANFVSGIIILFERPMKVGELVEIDKNIGQITKITLRSTVIETLKNGTLIVPNQYFIEQIVKNRSSAKLFARVVVSVAYGNDTEKVEHLLLEAAVAEMQFVPGIPNEPPDVRFINFRDSSLDFVVEVRVVDVEMKEQLESRIRHAIADIFIKNDIKLAEYPVTKEI
ncbi:mechanosensitive ion channel [Planococcus shenhongbingii]|uniref:mechanosensitive ion channel family protein n=1 Tax=Planococcus shenhongbingii TaxID=3058398 RepID=UPI0026286AA6|nr:mechanosensitive ion channel domain-containing protein [Planococcus sp. N016]WKA57761.1 mechanosensitive ion channel [Planococcus sp. N016]